MSKPYGVASYFGTYDDTNAPGISCIVAGAGTAVRKVQGAKVDFKSEAEVDDVNDGNGNPSGYNVRRRMWTLDLELVVRADTKANAALALRLPDEMTVVILTDFISDNDAFLNGNWAYISGGSVSLSDDGEAKQTIQLIRKFKGNGTEVTPATLLAAIA